MGNRHRPTLISFQLIIATLISSVIPNPRQHDGVSVRNIVNGFQTLNQKRSVPQPSNFRATPQYAPLAYYAPVHYGLPVMFVPKNVNARGQNFMKDYVSVPPSQQLRRLEQPLIMRQQAPYPQPYQQPMAAPYQQPYPTGVYGGQNTPGSPYPYQHTYPIYANTMNMPRNNYVLPGQSLSAMYDDYDESEEEEESSSDGMPVKVGDVALSFGFSGNSGAGGNYSYSTTTAKPAGFDWGGVLTGLMGGVSSIVQASAQKEMMANMQKTMLLTHLVDM